MVPINGEICPSLHNSNLFNFRIDEISCPPSPFEEQSPSAQKSDTQVQDLLRLLPLDESSIFLTSNKFSQRSFKSSGMREEKRVLNFSLRSTREGKKGRHYHSSFCHLCARTRKRRLVRCSNSLCTKSICMDCFQELHWELEDTEEEYVCPHCQDMCASLPTARCHIYQRTNGKRKSRKVV